MAENIWDFDVDADAISRAADAASGYGEMLSRLRQEMSDLLNVQRRLRAEMSSPPAGLQDTSRNGQIDFGSMSRGFQMLVPSLGVAYARGINPFVSMRHTIQRITALNLVDDAFRRSFARYNFFSARARAGQRYDIVRRQPSGLSTAESNRSNFNPFFPLAVAGGGGSGDWWSGSRRYDNSRDAVDAEYTMGGSSGYQWRGWRRFFEDLAGGPNSRRMRQANLWTEAGNSVGGLSGRMMRGVGSFMRLSAGLSALVIPVIAAGYAFKKLIGVCQQFYAVASENFRLFKLSASMNMLTPNGSANALDAQIKAIRVLGGDAASVSTLNAKLASARAMIGYGGRGGAFMEAARLFGVDIYGSGRYGLATNSEMLRHLARRMGQLDPESQIALANTMGLSPEMFWAMKDGLGNFENRMYNASTFLDRYANEGVFDREGIFGPTSGAFMGALSEEFVADWGEFVNSMKELGLVLGKAVLPALGLLLKIINAITQAISFLLNMITPVLGWVFRVAGKGLDAVFDKRPTDMPSPSEMDWDIRGAEEAVSEYDNTKIVNVNQVTVETPDVLTNDNATDFGRSVGEGVITNLAASTLSGTP